MHKKLWRRWRHGPNTTISQNLRGGGGGAGGCRIQGPGPGGGLHGLLLMKKDSARSRAKDALQPTSIGKAFSTQG